MIYVQPSPDPMLRGAQHSATHTTHIPAVAARPLACRADGFMATSFELSVRELLRSRQSENRIANDSARHLWTHSPDGPGTGGQAEHGMNGGFMNNGANGGLPFRGALDVDPSCTGNNRLARLVERNVVVYLGYILTSSVLIMECNCHNTAYFALLFAAQNTHILAYISHQTLQSGIESQDASPQVRVRCFGAHCSGCRSIENPVHRMAIESPSWTTRHCEMDRWRCRYCTYRRNLCSLPVSY